MEITQVVGLVVAIVSIFTGAPLLVKQFKTGKSEAKKNDAGTSKIAVEAANMVVETLRGEFQRQATIINELEHSNAKLDSRVGALEKQNRELKLEVKDCKEDREILIRIVRDNNISVREDDAKRLGI